MKQRQIKLYLKALSRFFNDNPNEILCSEQYLWLKRLYVAPTKIIKLMKREKVFNSTYMDVLLTWLDIHNHVSILERSNWAKENLIGIFTYFMYLKQFSKISREYSMSSGSVQMIKFNKDGFTTSFACSMLQNEDRQNQCTKLRYYMVLGKEGKQYIYHPNIYDKDPSIGVLYERTDWGVVDWIALDVSHLLECGQHKSSTKEEDLKVLNSLCDDNNVFMISTAIQNQPPEVFESHKELMLDKIQTIRRSICEQETKKETND